MSYSYLLSAKFLRGIDTDPSEASEVSRPRAPSRGAPLDSEPALGSSRIKHAAT